MSKKTVRFTESDLKRVISESVKKVLKEYRQSENEIARQTYSTISDLYDTWSEIRYEDGTYSETAGQVAGALRNVIDVLQDISRNNRQQGIYGYDFSDMMKPWEMESDEEF